MIGKDTGPEATALLRRQGLDVKDPGRKYQLGSLAGEFSELQLVSLKFAGLRRDRRRADTGFNLGAEYRKAELFERGRDGEGHG